VKRLRLLLFLLGVSVWASGCSSKSGTEGSRTAAPAASVPVEGDTADSRPVVVAFGNSLTAGLRVDPELNYPSRLQAKIDSAGYRCRVVNAGVSGDTSAQGLNRLDTVRRLHPSVVILELGGNDGLRGIPVTETRRNLSEIVRILTGDGARVVLAGMEIPPNYGQEYTREFHALYPGLAKEYGIALIPFFLQDVGGIPELNQDDGIHPNGQGYALVAENVWKALDPILRSLPASR